MKGTLDEYKGRLDFEEEKISVMENKVRNYPI